jgi:dTMP kinase
MSSSSLRGAFICFEGIDRSGKSTQCEKLVARLKSDGVRVRHIRFPDRKTASGKVLDAYLRSEAKLDDRAVHLLFSANRWEAAALMRDELEQGTTLVVDRYAYSGVAFTAAKGIDVTWCKAPDVGLPRPDVVVFLELAIEEAMTRGDYGNERYEREDFQRAVLGAYGQLRDERFVGVDATLGVDDIHERIVRISRDTVARVASNRIDALWLRQERQESQASSK